MYRHRNRSKHVRTRNVSFFPEQKVPCDNSNLSTGTALFLDLIDSLLAPLNLLLLPQLLERFEASRDGTRKEIGSFKECELLVVENLLQLAQQMRLARPWNTIETENGRFATRNRCSSAGPRIHDLFWEVAQRFRRTVICHEPYQRRRFF